MRFDSFEEVDGLRLSQKRSLLSSGDPRERVWAAWSLGLELGARWPAAALEHEPDHGVRRHMLVMEAGFRAEPRVVRAAQEDPSPRVRLTAFRCLVHLRRADLLRVVLDAVERDPSPLVRRALIRSVPAPWPAHQLRVLERAAWDRDRPTREAATDRLVSERPIDALFPGVLEQRVYEETNADHRRRLLELAFLAGRGPLIASRLLGTKDLSLEVARDLLLGSPSEVPPAPTRFPLLCLGRAPN